MTAKNNKCVCPHCGFIGLRFEPKDARCYEEFNCNKVFFKAQDVEFKRENYDGCHWAGSQTMSLFGCPNCKKTFMS